MATRNQDCAIDIQHVVKGFTSVRGGMPLEIIDPLIKGFDYQSYVDRRSAGLKKAKFIVSNFTGSELFIDSKRCDLFRVLGIRFNENCLSNFYAMILNPSRFFLAIPILSELLKEAGEHVLANLVNIMPHNRFKVVREKPGSCSRIDLRIEAKDSSHAIVIDIEMKTKGGSEHKHKGDWQTNNEWKDLQNRVDTLRGKYHQDIKCAAIFISPYGIKAMCPYFKSISRERLNEIILRHLGARVAFQGDSPSAEFVGALTHFLESPFLF